MHKYTVRRGVLELVMIGIALLFLVPILSMINQSFRDPADNSSPLAPTTHPTGQNYSLAWNQAHLGSALLNSAIVTIASVAVIVTISSLAAYAFARITSRWSQAAFLFVAAGLLIPAQIGLIPLYSTMRDLGLLGSVWGLVLYYAGLQVPFSTFLYTAFMRGLPQDYEEAAFLDGCGPLSAFWRVVFPMLAPITGTVVILNAVHVWNDFMTPLLFLSGSDQQTLPVALFGFVGQYVSQWNLVFAGLVITIAPMLIIYFALQKFIIKGFAGGLKG